MNETTTYVGKVVFYGNNHNDVLTELDVDMFIIPGDSLTIEWAPVPPKAHRFVIPGEA